MLLKLFSPFSVFLRVQVSKSTSELYQFFRVVKEEAAYPVLTLADEVVGWEEGESGVAGRRSQVMLTSSSLVDLQLHRL